MPHPREEVEAAVARYVEVRERMDRGEGGWEDMAALFTDDATYIDPAWGRIDGIAEIKAFMSESMAGLEDWLFPIEWIAIDGDHVVVKWTQRLPGQRADGSHYDNSGRVAADLRGRAGSSPRARTTSTCSTSTR